MTQRTNGLIGYRLSTESSDPIEEWAYYQDANLIRVDAEIPDVRSNTGAKHYRPVFRKIIQECNRNSLGMVVNSRRTFSTVPVHVQAMMVYAMRNKVDVYSVSDGKALTKPAESQYEKQREDAMKFLVLWDEYDDLIKLATKIKIAASQPKKGIHNTLRSEKRGMDVINAIRSMRKAGVTIPIITEVLNSDLERYAPKAAARWTKRNVERFIERLKKRGMF